MIGARFPGFEMIPTGARAGLIIVHGIAEHSGRYRHVAEALAANQIACFAYDQQGHGEYPGARTHVADFAEFARDLELVGESIHEKWPNLPLFVWGHSMGSIVVTLAAINGLRWARGAISSGCALDAMPKLDGIAGNLLRVAATLAPLVRISLRIDATALTQDLEMQRRHMSDPLIPRTASLKLLYGFAVACRESYANAPAIRLPWLALHGEADKVCPLNGSQALIGALGSSDKQLVTYPGLLHEVHNEDAGARARLFAVMTRWILKRS